MKSIAEDALKEALKYTDNAEVLIEEDQSMKVELQNDKIDFAKNEVNSLTAQLSYYKTLV